MRVEQSLFGLKPCISSGSILCVFMCSFKFLWMWFASICSMVVWVTMGLTPEGSLGMSVSLQFSHVLGMCFLLMVSLRRLIILCLVQSGNECMRNLLVFIVSNDL